MSPQKLGPKDSFVVVDVQVDFCPGGALPAPEGDRVVPVLNDWIAAAQRGGAKIVASRDWHPPGHCSFQEQGGAWPVHCVKDTPGARFHPDLRLPDGVQIVDKGVQKNRDNYSPFDRTGLAEQLKQEGIARVWVGGLVLDVCVRATVMDAIDAGFETHLILDATRAVDVEPGDGERALEEMRQAGAVIETESAP